MHMADALLSPQTGAAFWAGSVGVMAYAAKKLRQNLDDKLIPLMGVLGAFIFAVQMINFTIPATGSSGHIGGGMLLAILLGPYAAFIVISSVLFVQALFFADGGLLALGSNIWNLGVYPCFIAYPLIYKPIVKEIKTKKRIMLASVLSVIAALELGALSVVLQTGLSGITELPFRTFLMLMLAIHLPIAAIEGLITGGIVNYVKTVRPDIIEGIGNPGLAPAGGLFKKVIFVIAILALLVGGVFSWMASEHPDGLEWSIQKIYGSTEIPRKNSLTEGLSDIQKKTAVMPDPVASSAAKTATSISGILGSIIVLFLVLVLGLGIKIAKKIRHKP